MVAVTTGHLLTTTNYELTTGRLHRPDTIQLAQPAQVAGVQSFVPYGVNDHVAYAGADHRYARHVRAFQRDIRQRGYMSDRLRVDPLERVEHLGEGRAFCRRQPGTTTPEVLGPRELLERPTARHQQ